MKSSWYAFSVGVVGVGVSYRNHFEDCSSNFSNQTVYILKTKYISINLADPMYNMGYDFIFHLSLVYSLFSLSIR